MRRPQHRKPRRLTTIIVVTAITTALIAAIVTLIASNDKGSQPQSTPQPTNSVLSQTSPPSMTDPTPYTGDVTCAVAPTATNPYAGCLYNKEQGIRLTVNLDGNATLIGGGLPACGVPYSLGSYASQDCPQMTEITFSGPFTADKITGTITKTITSSTATPAFGQEGEIITLATTKATGLFQFHIENIGGLSLCRAENELQLGECSEPQS